MNEQELRNAIAELEAQRGILPDDVIEVSLAALKRQLSALPQVNHQGLLYVILASDFTLTDSATTRRLRHLYDLQLSLKSIATEYGGTLNTRSGYNVLAAFHAATQRDTIHATLQAALAIRHEIQTIAPERMAIKVYVQIGAHLASKDADLELFGRSDHPDLLTLEALAETAAPNQILISYAIYREARLDYTIHYAKSVEVPQIQETVRMYMLSGTKENPELQTSEVYTDLRTVMIGRHAELETLQRALRACMGERNRQAITIVGEAGTGKTRLLEEFQDWLDIIPERVWYFKGQATPSTRLQPYGLIRDILVRRFEITSQDSYQRAYEKFLQGIIEILGENALQKAILISRLVGLNFSSSAISVSEELPLQDEAIKALLDFFAMMFNVYRDPIVIVLEHIQWSDEGSLSFLQQLLTYDEQPIPILLLMTARTTAEESPSSWYEENTIHSTPLLLEPLPVDLAKLLIAETLRNMTEIPEHLIDVILEKTQGNPRHIFELLHNMLDTGTIVRDVDGWRLNEVAFLEYTMFSMPELAQARLFSLSDAAQQIIVCGAIIGDVFWDKAIRHMAKLTENSSFTSALNELLHKGIIRQHVTTNFPSATEYQFHNGLLRRFVYEHTPSSTRQHYHARFASWLIGQGMNRVSQYVGVIALHYQAANEAQRAIKWHSMAARQAERFFSSRTAVYHYEQIAYLAQFNLESNLTAYINALMGLASIYHDQLRYDDAFALYQEVLERTPNTPEAAEALAEIAYLYNRLGHSQEALAYAQQAIELLSVFDHNQQHRAWGKAWVNLSRAYRRLSNYEQALKYAEQALDFAQSIHNDTLSVEAYNVLGTLYVSSGRNAEMGMVYFNKALAIAKRLGDLKRAAQLSNNIAETARLRGDYQSALVMYRQTEETARRIGNRQIITTSMMNAGAAWLGLRKYKRALVVLQSALSLLESETESEPYCEALCLYSETLVHLEKFSEAEENLKQAYYLATKLEQPALIAKIWRVLGILCAKQDRVIELNNQVCDAITCFQQSYAILDQNDLLLDKAHTLKAWGYYLAETGEAKAANAVWQQAAELFGHMGAVYEQESIQNILDELKYDE
ncbi:MAG: hypothetical protein CUN55_03945 [Phototrophicales bacterium]|nr:MAG: hypothetical protein CUN55_03945 [Phototrophicales bacterium]